MLKQQVWICHPTDGSRWDTLRFKILWETQAKKKSPKEEWPGSPFMISARQPWESEASWENFSTLPCAPVPRLHCVAAERAWWVTVEWMTQEKMESVLPNLFFDHGSPAWGYPKLGTLRKKFRLNKLEPFHPQYSSSLLAFYHLPLLMAPF